VREVSLLEKLYVEIVESSGYFVLWEVRISLEGECVYGWNGI